MNSNISISGTISGSLRKFSKEISQVVMEFKKKGIKILSPIISEIINEGAQFIYFDHDKTKPIALIEQSHLKSIDHSDFLYVVCPNGYIGNSTLLEIGYAIAIKKKIYSSEPPEDLLLKKLIEYNKTIPEIIDSVVECKKEEKPLDPEKLPEIQKYIKLKVIERGFEHETETETLLLLLEEVGELARAVRKYSGIKIQEKRLLEKNSPVIEDELADIFIYVLILANKFGVDLYESFKSKERKNDKKNWVTFDPISQIGQ